MNGSRRTARFIARALFTTCGRNIRPDPNRSPTIFIPSISGLDHVERPRSALASSASPDEPTIPRTSANESPPPRARARQIDLSLVASPETAWASTSLGGVRASVEEHVLDALQQPGSMSSDGQLTGVDDPHVEAARMVEEGRVHGPRRTSLPREGERQARDPPGVRARAKALDQRQRPMKAFA
jgi:hypothetical protein